MDAETRRRIERRVRKLDSSVEKPRTCSVCQAEIELMGSTRSGAKQPRAAQKPGSAGTPRCSEHTQHTFH